MRSGEDFHIRRGQKWMPALLQTYGYSATPEQIRERMAAWMMANTPVKMQQRHAPGIA